jgi:hypothetical protein
VGIFVFSPASKVKQSRVCAVVEWKDGRKTRHSLANIRMFGGDEGFLPLHLKANYSMYKEIKEIAEILNTR